MSRAMSFIGVVGALGVMAGCSGAPKPAHPAIPTQEAARAFNEAASLCKAEGGKLWGQSLCGPMLFVDPATHQAVLNEPSPGAVPDGAVFRLTLPPETGVANTSIKLGDQRWTMIIWPLPEASSARAILMMHESYHRIQPALGLDSKGGLGTNLHLDTRDGRVWMRAEFRALSSALRSEGDARRQALSDALLFRAYRQSLWPDAASQERDLEFNEGLAESTGIDAALSDPTARVTAALGDLSSCEAAPTFVRSFAYGTGPAYAELLDAEVPDWRRSVRGDFDFAAEAAAAYKVDLPSPSKEAAESALARYDGSSITAQEDARQKLRDEQDARFTRLFIEGPTVRFPLVNKSITFNPREVAAFEDHGSVYGTVQLSDLWGTLEVRSGGALISKDFREAFVPAATDTTTGHPEGSGWKASLTKGYSLAPDPDKPGSFVVESR
jgi:hypothetical protein